MSVLEGLEVVRSVFPKAVLPPAHDPSHDRLMNRLHGLSLERRPVTQVEFAKLMDTLGLSVVDGVVRVG